MLPQLLLITTLAIVLVFGVVLSYPRLTAYLDKADIELPSFSGEEELSKVALKNNSEISDRRTHVGTVPRHAH